MTIELELVPEELGLRDPAFVGAFMGWPDASMGASGALRFLVESLHASPLATWDGDEYYDFGELRPVSRVIPPRDRILIWPQGEFWVARAVPVERREGTAGPLPPAEPEQGPADESAPSDDSRSLILFLAAEPRLRWRTYARELASFAQRCGVRQAVFLGSAFADVPHTRPPIVTGWATEPRLRTKLEALGVPFSAYQGPSSMASAAIEAFRALQIPSASLFSNGPHYLPLPNANLSLALLRRLAGLLDLRLDLRPLQEAGEALIRQASAAMDDKPEFREHVRQLEAQYDEQAAPLAPGEVRRELERRAQADAAGPLNVDPQDVVRELEDFLRRRSQGRQPPPGEPGEGSSPPDGPPTQ
jgi:LmbE family N-acetylglucosaminyl deacetylase